jgi:hypothetical protein
LPSSSDTAWVGVSNCRTATPNGCPSTTVLRTTGPWLDLGTGDARAPRWHRWRRSLPKAAWAVAGGSDGVAPSPRRRSSIRPTAAKAGSSAMTPARRRDSSGSGRCTSPGPPPAAFSVPPMRRPTSSRRPCSRGSEPSGFSRF